MAAKRPPLAPISSKFVVEGRTQEATDTYLTDFEEPTNEGEQIITVPTTDETELTPTRAQ